MSIFKKFFRKKNRQEELVQGFISYYEGIYSSIVESCEKETMDYYSARGMFRHLPLRYDTHNIYPEEINQIVDNCFKTLYAHCIKKSLIDSTITYEEFYRGKGLYDDSYPINKTRHRQVC